MVQPPTAGQIQKLLTALAVNEAPELIFVPDVFMIHALSGRMDNGSHVSQEQVKMVGSGERVGGGGGGGADTVNPRWPFCWVVMATSCPGR